MAAADPDCWPGPGVFNDPSNDPLALQSAYGLLDARLTWDSPDRHWQAAAVIQNALDKVYYINKYDNSGSFGVVNGQPGWPLTALFTIKRKFRRCRRLVEG